MLRMIVIIVIAWKIRKGRNYYVLKCTCSNEVILLRALLRFGWREIVDFFITALLLFTCFNLRNKLQSAEFAGARVLRAWNPAFSAYLIGYYDAILVSKPRFDQWTEPLAVDHGHVRKLETPMEGLRLWISRAVLYKLATVKRCDWEARILYVTLSVGERVKVKNINYTSELAQWLT
jgi:hypothetical protein